MKNLMKIQLIVFALVLLFAGSAFATPSFNVSVDTASLNHQDGYLYFQYIPVNGADSTATVFNFTTDGVLAALPSANVVDGSAVSGQLPGSVVFANTNGINDYNHGIRFGNSINFLLSFSNPASALPVGGGSTFSLALFADEGGATTLLGGTLYTIDLMNDGTTITHIQANESTVIPTPEPSAALLLSGGLMGLIGIRKKLQK